MEIKKSKDLHNMLHDYMLVAFGMFVMLMIGVVLTHGVYLRGESDSSSWWSAKLEELVKNEEGDVDDFSSNTASDADADEGVSVTQELEIIPNEDRTVFEVRNLGVRVGEIKREGPASVNIWRDLENIYLGVQNYGMGGYILFGGPDEVYEVDESSVTQVYDGSGKNGFASDMISGKLVAIEDPSTEGWHPSVVVYDLTTQKSQSYEVSAPYSVAGKARFSQAGGKVVYEAALNNPDNEQYAMYMIDLATGKQTQVGNAENLD